MLVQQCDKLLTVERKLSSTPNIILSEDGTPVINRHFPVLGGEKHNERIFEECSRQSSTTEPRPTCYQPSPEMRVAVGIYLIYTHDSGMASYIIVHDELFVKQKVKKKPTSLPVSTHAKAPEIGLPPRERTSRMPSGDSRL